MIVIFLEKSFVINEVIIKLIENCLLTFPSFSNLFSNTLKIYYAPSLIFVQLQIINILIKNDLNNTNQLITNCINSLKSLSSFKKDDEYFDQWEEILISSIFFIIDRLSEYIIILIF